MIDLGPLLDAVNPINLFSHLLEIVSQQLANALRTIWDGLWHSGVNIYTYTDPKLTYQFSTVADLLLGMRILVGAISGVAVVLAAASLAGREVFGWGESLGEHLGRIVLGAILANGAAVWVQLAIDLNNRLCEAIGGASLPSGFGGYGVDPLSASILLSALVWFGLKLGFKMAYRIGMLWILIPVAPVALACWAIPQTQWVATTWTRLFIGWTFGQVLVTIALKLGTVVGPFGPAGASVGGVLFSIAMIAIASDAADLLVRAGRTNLATAGGASYVARAAFAIRTAVAAAYARVPASPQLRLPGF